MEREISIILKVKGTEAAKKAVQSVFDQKTADLIKTVNDQTKKAGDNLERAGRKAKGASQGVNSFTKTLGKSLSILYLYQRAWSTFGAQFDEGLQLQRASTQFERHVGNVTKMLPELRTATKGVVSDFDLLKTAQRAFQQGIKPQNIATAFKLGTSAAQKLGLSTTEAINMVTNAMTSQDEGALKSLGIIPKVNQAYQTQTALIAKNGGVMSKAMTIQLRQSLIMRELQNRFGGVNKAQEDGLMSLDRLRASWKNFRAVLGETLGHALLPLTRALTGVLELVTRLLEKLNKTEGFKRFVQLAGTLGVILGSIKFIAGARSLLTLFGVIGGTGGFKAAKTFQLLTKSSIAFRTIIGMITKRWRNFVVALGFVAPKLAEVLARIPGFRTAITAAILLFKPLMKLITGAWTAAKVFFQLLNNFDENSGLSKVLREDAEELGSAYNLIENIAKISLETWAALKGLGQGLSEIFSPISGVLKWTIDKLEELGVELFNVDKIANRSSSRLEQITERWKNFAKVILAIVSPLSRVLLAINSLENARENYVKTHDPVTGAALNKPTTSPSSTSSATVEAWRSGSNSTKPATAPTPRAMNLDYTPDLVSKFDELIKQSKTQTGIMETEVQMNEIEKSQSNAQRNINIRR